MVVGGQDGMTLRMLRRCENPPTFPVAVKNMAPFRNIRNTRNRLERKSRSIYKEKGQKKRHTTYKYISRVCCDVANVAKIGGVL